jgi:arylsulfatase A-like enzyme/Flp pilus assembly protein TadD
LLVSALLAALAACAPPAPAPPHALVLITIDTLRADRLGVYGGRTGTPRLDALARRGTWFRRARTTVPLTLPSHATILTGLPPAVHGVRNNGSFRLPPRALTLAEILHERGWRTGAVVGAFILDAQFGLAQGFDQYDASMSAASPGRGLEGPERTAAAVTDAALSWLAQRDSGPFFLWAHYFDPHTPYAPPEPYLSRHPGAPYDGEVEYTDHEVGRLLDALAARPDAADIVVAVAGDHGESLGEHNEMTHGVFVYEGVLRVPLILAGKGVPARGADGRAASTLDLLPTLLGILRIDPPAGLPGRDLLTRGSEDAQAPPRAIFAETLLPCLNFGWSGSETVIEADLKLIVGVAPELYDLGADPAESGDLGARRPADRERLEGLLARQNADWRAARAAAVDAGGAPGLPDAETRARLESLGYLAGAGAPPGGCRSGPDPRRMLPVLQVIDQGVREYHDGRHEAAAAAFRRALRLDPGNTMAHYYLGSALRTLGRHREAVAELAAAIERDPDNFTFRHEEAAEWFALGDLVRAESRLREALWRAPDVPKTRFFLGNVLLARGRAREALAEYEAARAAMPPAADLEFERGRALLALERRPEAIDAIRLSCSLAPERADWRGILAGLLAAEGRVQEAVQVLREFLDRHPDDPLALYNLGVLLEASGDAAEALRMYHRAEPRWTADAAKLKAMRERIRRLEASSRP